MRKGLTPPDEHPGGTGAKRASFQIEWRVAGSRNPNRKESFQMKETSFDQAVQQLRAKGLRLPNPTCLEDLESRWRVVLPYGDRVLLAGYYYAGPDRPHFFGAVYEHLDDDRSCEGALGLAEVSAVEFEDEGHAIAWAMQQL